MDRERWWEEEGEDRKRKLRLRKDDVEEMRESARLSLVGIKKIFYCMKDIGETKQKCEIHGRGRKKKCAINLQFIPIKDRKKV